MLAPVQTPPRIENSVTCGDRLAPHLPAKPPSGPQTPTPAAKLTWLLPGSLTCPQMRKQLSMRTCLSRVSEKLQMESCQVDRYSKEPLEELRMFTDDSRQTDNI